MTNNRQKEQKRCPMRVFTGMTPQGQPMMIYPFCPQTNAKPESNLLGMSGDYCEFWIDDSQECGFILMINEIRNKQPQIHTD